MRTPRNLGFILFLIFNFHSFTAQFPSLSFDVLTVSLFYILQVSFHLVIQSGGAETLLLDSIRFIQQNVVQSHPLDIYCFIDVLYNQGCISSSCQTVMYCIREYYYYYLCFVLLRRSCLVGGLGYEFSVGWIVDLSKLFFLGRGMSCFKRSSAEFSVKILMFIHFQNNRVVDCFPNGLGYHRFCESLDGPWETRTHSKARDGCHMSTSPVVA